VIEVAVREQNSLDAHSKAVDRGEDPIGLVAGVDDQGAIGARSSKDVTVLGDRADRELTDVHQEPLRASRSA
jgi:hypothetical protein